jgi:hypothetical protein
MPTTAQMTYYWCGKILHRISAPNISKIAQGDVEVLFGMSPTNDPIGYRQGQHPAHSISFTTPVFTTDPEVDWELEARIHFEGFFTEAGGVRPRSFHMKVESAEGSVDDKRNKTLSVVLKGWQLGNS